MKKRHQKSDTEARVIRVDPYSPDLSLVREAAELVKKGGLAVFPTRCLYGLGADIYLKNSVARVFYAKNRHRNRPVSILIPSIRELEKFAADVSGAAEKLISAFWPGRVTIVFPAGETVPAILTGNTGKIGIRVPSHPVAAALLCCLEHPLTGTSANLSGSPGCSSVSELPTGIMQEAAAVLDAGPLEGGAGSTVVDAAVDPPVVLREGLVPEAEIRRILG